MASLFLDIEDVALTEEQAKVLTAKVQALVSLEHPDAKVEINGDSEYDAEDDGEDAEG